MIIYNIDTFPYHHLYDYPIIRHHKNTYVNIEAAFDIETTNIYCKRRMECKKMRRGECNGDKCRHWIKPTSYMYHWQACIGNDVIFGRTWEEYQYFVKKVALTLGLSNRKRLVFYVHNLGFEFQFLRSYFEFTEVFAREKRRPMKAVAGGIEYRCSYMLSNMSLAKFCENTPNVIHGKLKGSFDYDKIRTSKTPLTEQEKAYCFNDVKGLAECIHEYLKEDTIGSIPLTSTGFVRRDCRNAWKKNKKNKRNMQKNALTYEQYLLCKEAFRGGNTHANHVYADKIIRNVKSVDIASSYPYVLMTKRYPTKFVRENPAKLKQYCTDEWSFLVKCRFRGVKYKGTCNIPYIPVSKTIRESDENGNLIPRKLLLDNGRILTADRIVMTLTNIDLEIIYQEYDIESMEVSEFHVARNEYIEPELREKILEYFHAKSTLKGVSGKEYEYMKSKNKLNGIYGMMVTDILMDDVLYENGWKDAEEKTEDEKRKALSSYYKNPNSFLTYQVGVWVTAYARQSLQNMLTRTGADTVYCDTDADKFIGDHSQDIKEINEAIIAEIKNAPIPPHVTHNGRDYYMGLFEDDGEYEEFITLGAKKYCVNKHGKISTTVAGLGKTEGAARITELGIRHFCHGTVFFPSGRLNAYYNDYSETIYIQGEKIETGSNLCFMPGTYILGITDEYKELLSNHYSRL